MKKPVALILCGGSGTRMLPWAAHLNKCLVRAHDGDRLFVRHARALAREGFEVWANPPDAHLDDFERATRTCVQVNFMPETGAPNGSGTTLLRLAAKRRADSYTVVYGDTFLLNEFYVRAAAWASRWKGSVILTRGLPDRQKTVGGLIWSDAGRVTRVHEGPLHARRLDPSVRVQAGLLTIREEAFGRRKAVLGLDIMRDLVPQALSRGIPFQTQSCDGYESCDLGSPERYAAYVLTRYPRRAWGNDGSALKAALELLSARRIVTAGNGGACAVAAHAALDWSKAGGKWASSLTDPCSITAWGNDSGYAESLAGQIRRQRWFLGDVLVLFSASGNSPNIIAAVHAARSFGEGRPRIVGVTCRAENMLAETADLLVPLDHPTPATPWGYGPVEDSMQAYAHAVAALMEGLRPMSETGP